MKRQIGRYEIRGELGRGAQSVVYLGFDPQLQREVAIKTLHFVQPDPAFNQTLLSEARTTGRMRHAGIVPIFDAGEVEGDLYLVFEYVSGESLGSFLAQSGPLSPVRALALMRPILSALAHAHGQGVVHRDLKPSNILLDEHGNPRVMDFGIASQLNAPDAFPGKLVGTPAYMAPEYILAGELSPGGDVFAAGLIFCEMLLGRHPVEAGDLRTLLNALANEDVRLPEQPVLDARLCVIIGKALAREPQKRYADASEFADALAAYAEADEAGQPVGEGRQATIDFLLRRMRHKSDFPALSESVSAINRIANSERESVERLSNTILKDFALTNKLLRMVNTAYFRPAGGGTISTISRAVIVLGFETVRNIAITILLFEHLQHGSSLNRLKEDFLRANLAGMLAKDIGSAAKMRDQEQSFICALFHSLGRLLGQYYFAEESEEIRRLMSVKHMSEDQAALQVLGVSFEEMGMAIAREWGFPPLLIESMRRLPAGPLHKPQQAEERLRLLSAMANEICDVIALVKPESREREMTRALARFTEVLPVAREEIEKTIGKAIGEVTEFARLIHLNLLQTEFGRQMRLFAQPGWTANEERPGLANSGQGGDSLGAATVLADQPLAAFSESTQLPGADAQNILTAGIQDISNTLVDGFKLNDILRIILETMYRAMGFKRVILCIKDVRAGVMQGRFGFGPDADEVARSFRFPLAFSPDFFHAATAKGLDMLVSDINDPKTAERIPDWYRKVVPARSFVLFPLNLKGNPVALIYADRDEAGSIVIPEKELSLLRTLRNQAVLAIKQSS